MSGEFAGRRATRVLGLLLIGVVAGTGLGWAARTLLAPPDPLPPGRSYALVTVAEGEVARSLSLNAAARWRSGEDVVNGASGTLTHQRSPLGAPVEVGDVIYTVDLRPVIAMAGRIPVFRDLTVGDEGADVKQLQRFLKTVHVRHAAPTGRFDASTTDEVRQWQGDVGLPATGTFARSSVVVVRSLPAVLSFTDLGVVGERLEPGTVVAHVLATQPTFSIVLPAGQRQLVSQGMTVLLHRGESTWEARLGMIGEVDEDGSATAALVPAPGQDSICGNHCGEVPLAGDGALRSTIVVIPAQRGTVVPTAALVVGDEGSSVVVDAAGRMLPVTVVASASGSALVSGVDVGEQIRVPGEAIG